MHILVSLPIDAYVEDDLLLSNVRKGLGSAGPDCDLLALPALESDGVDCLFEAEERIRTLEPLVQDTIEKFVSTYSEIHKQPLAESGVLGKTFDHFIKTFKWDSLLYPTSVRISELLTLMESEITSLISSYSKKEKAYLGEKKKVEAAERRRTGSIHDIDVNHIAFGSPSGCAETFCRKYYVAIPGGLKQEAEKKLSQISGLFIEARTCVYKSKEGEIYEVMGQAEDKDSVVHDLEANGFLVKRQCATEGEYRAIKEEEAAVMAAFSAAEEALLSLVSKNLLKLFVLMMHVKVLSLYIESILRFGLPAQFCFFVHEVKNAQKAVGKWKNVARHWGYSARVTSVSKMVVGTGKDLLFDFVCGFIRDFTMQPIEKI